MQTILISERPDREGPVPVSITGTKEMVYKIKRGEKISVPDEVVSALMLSHEANYVHIVPDVITSGIAKVEEIQEKRGPGRPRLGEDR